jgi:hypothetical protein
MHQTTPAASTCQPTNPLAGRLHRPELQHRPSSVPGRDIVQIRTEIPSGTASGWRTQIGLPSAAGTVKLGGGVQSTSTGSSWTSLSSSVVTSRLPRHSYVASLPRRGANRGW